MDRPHFLVRTTYLPRCFGFTLAIALTVLLRGDELTADPIQTAFLTALLAYPHILFQVSMRFFNTARAARLAMLVDSLLVGMLISLNQYYLFAMVAYLSFLMLSVALIAGPWFVLANVGLAAFVAVFCGLFQPEILTAAPLEADLGLAAAWMIYPGFVAWQVYTVTSALGIARRDERAGRKSLQSTTEQLRRYISPQLFRTVLDASGEHATRRRKLSVCFTDLTGFTSLMDSLPEDTITALLNEYLNEMADIAIDFGGTIDKFMGDGMMIYFGEPDSRGAREDAIACVRMALQMRSTLAKMSRGWRRAGIANQLRLRVGIHTGYCAVGNFGSEHRMDYTAVGGAVNIASRLEACAGANGILISESTAALASDCLNLAPAVQRRLKGIRRPVETYRVLGERQHCQFAQVNEQVPGLDVALNPSELDPVAAKALLQECLALVGKHGNAPGEERVVLKLLR